ncbi:PPR26 phosphatase, partial [Spelaeornis formosus]|nr:PPR26 phosphatase [Elachura formosa]
MFLMDAPPLVALQTKWESFGPARNCRYPVCFPESTSNVTRTSVSAKVQMVINSLQSQEPALGMSNECDCATRKKQEGEKGTGSRVSPALLRKHPRYAQCGCPEDPADSQAGENVEFGTLLLDSDSDDSVDRGIEEAIQEYLKTKGKSAQSLARNAEGSENVSRDKRFKREFSQNKVASKLLPVKFKAEMLSEEYLSDHLGIGKLQPASPQSVSSDDSFEQSIQAEIVQFLNEKKQQEISKCATEGDKKDSRVRSVLKCNKETPNRTTCGAVKQGCNALLLRHHTKLQKSGAQSKCLQSKMQAEPSDFRQVNQAYLEMATASQPWLVEQDEGGGARCWEPREALPKEGVHTSDSSSDDGIEEAIQLYQLEKTKKEAGHAANCVPLQREQFDPKGLADISASLTISSTKSASPEIHKNPTNSKRKEINSKSMGLESTSDDFNKLFKPLKKARHFALPENKIAACELTLQASCRADTSAELMCAEAILDISKTIMPSQMGSDNKSLSADSFFSPQCLSSSRCESDSSLVDSDDSIEQEIRAFLALKAQSENLGEKPPSLSRSMQMALPSEPNSLTETLGPALPKTLKLSLSQKRRLKREGRAAKQGGSKLPEQLETGLLQPRNYSSFSVLQEERALGNPTELGDALSAKDPRQQQLMPPTLSGSDGSRCVALDSVKPFLQAQSSTGEPVKNPTQTPEREGSGDESSSLDSDEDLDSAIKDLLRSKRKLKKKSKDQKAQCKKKVRFSETETQLLDEFSSLQQNEWKCKNPPLLKSCLSKPRKAVRENAVRNPPDSTKLPNDKPETVKNLDCNLQLKKGNKPKTFSNQRGAKNRKCALPAVWDASDSSSVDSDDSIEQEIRRFLAEKAKDSASSSEMQKGDASLDLFRATKQSGNKGKAKQPVENEVDAVLGQSKKAEVAQQTEEAKNSQRTEGKSAMLAGSGKFASSAENVPGQSKARQGLAGVRGGAAALPGSAAGRRSGRSAEAPKPSRNEGCKGRKGVSAKPRSKRKNTFQLKISSKFIAGLKYARDRKKSMLLNKKQKAECLLTQSNASGAEAASQDTDVLHPLPKGECSGEMTAAITAPSSPQTPAVGGASPEPCAGAERLQEAAEGCGRAGAAGGPCSPTLSSQERAEAARGAGEVCRAASGAESTPSWMEESQRGSWAGCSPGPQSRVRREAQHSAQVGSKAGERQLDERPDPGSACPGQEVSVAAAAAVHSSGGASAGNSVQLCLEEDRADRQEEIQVSSSKLEGKAPVQQNREAASEGHQGQEFLTKTCAKFTDLPAGDCPDSLLEKKVSNM